MVNKNGEYFYQLYENIRWEKKNIIVIMQQNMIQDDFEHNHDLLT